MIWKRFFNELFTWLFLMLFGYLAGKKIISDDLASNLAISAGEFGAFLIITIAFPVVLTWIRKKFNNKLLENAYCANPAKETLDDVKEKTAREFRINSVSSLLLAILIGGMIFPLAACPKKDSVRAAAGAAYRLPGLTNDAINATRSAFEKGFISADQKDRLALLYVRLARSEKQFVEMIDLYVKTLDQTNAPDAGSFQKITAFLRSDLIEPFLQVLAEFRALPPNASAFLKIAVDSIRLVLIQIADSVSIDNRGLKGL